MAPYGYSYGRKCFGELHKPSTYFKVFVSVLKNRLRGKKLAKGYPPVPAPLDPPLPPPRRGKSGNSRTRCAGYRTLARMFGGNGGERPLECHRDYRRDVPPEVECSRRQLGCTLCRRKVSIGGTAKCRQNALA